MVVHVDSSSLMVVDIHSQLRMRGSTESWHALICTCSCTCAGSYVYMYIIHACKDACVVTLAWGMLFCRVKLSPRARAVVREMSGIFPNATVVRGHDWRWAEQDGRPYTLYILWEYMMYMYISMGIYMYMYIHIHVHAHYGLYVFISQGGEGNTGIVCSIKDWKTETTVSGEFVHVLCIFHTYMYIPVHVHAHACTNTCLHTSREAL